MYNLSLCKVLRLKIEGMMIKAIFNVVQFAIVMSAMWSLNDAGKCFNLFKIFKYI